MAYEQLTGPVGPTRDDIHTARLMERITNAMGGGKGQPPTAAKFLPGWGERREDFDGDDQESADQAGGDRG